MFKRILKDIKGAAIYRPLVLFSISLSIGILTASLSNSLIIAFLFVFLVTIVCLLAARMYREIKFTLIGLALFYSLGACEFLYFKISNTDKFKEFIGKEAIITGYIDAEPDIREARTNYIIKVTDINVEGVSRKVEGKVLFSTLTSKKGNIYNYGSQLIINGSLNRAKGVRNPGGFDYQRYLAQSGISATIFATESNVKLGEENRSSLLVKGGLALRDKIVGVINRSLYPEQAGLLNGMLIGYRKGLTEPVQEAFSNAGLTHIMAVSGANVAFIIMPVLFIFKRIGLTKRNANIITIGILILFIFITGFSPSVVRAVIMAITILSGQILRRESDVYTSLAFAAVLMLIPNPYTLFDIGFQLSFGATLSLVLFYNNIKALPCFKHLPEFITDVLACTLAAQVGVLPITAFYFNKLSVISIISNLLVVPVTQGITILGFAMAILGQVNIVLSQIIGYVNMTLLTFILYTTKISASIPYAVVTVVTPSVLSVVVYYVFVLFFLWYKPKLNIKLRVTHYAFILGAVLAMVLITNLIPKNLEVVFIDVGQGDSALVKTKHGKTVLIDGGGHESKTDDGPNIGDTTVIPLMLDYGISKLDMVIATHGHDDHIQGLIPILRDFNVDSLVIPDNPEKEKEFKSLYKAIGHKAINIKACKRGDKIQLDKETNMVILHPKKGYNPVNSTLNNGSLVLKLNYMSTSIMFTGDMEEEIESLQVSDDLDLESDVLKVAHHGSPTSSSPDYLDKVKAKAAIISVGTNNFGHPSPRTLDSLVDRNISLFRTDRDGAIILTSDGRNIKIKRTIMVGE